MTTPLVWIAAIATAMSVTACSSSRPADADRDQYLRRIVISQVAAHPKDLKDDAVLVEGEVNNTGDRSLAQVQVMIYFLDRAGTPVHGGAFTAQVVNTNQPPLKSQESRPWSCDLKRVPEEWDGEVDVTVTDVQFSAS